MTLFRQACLATLSGFCLISSAWAATVVENKDASGQIQKVMLEGNYARMEGANAPDGYMLIDLEKHKMYAVNPQQKMIVDMLADPPPQMPPGGKPPGQPDAPELNAELVKVGDGPEIAGYATTHYQIKADGQVCANEYVSSEAMEVPMVGKFVNAMQEISDSRRQAMGNMPFGQMPPCARAMRELSDDVAKHGLSMRTTGPNGKVRQEVAKITTDVKTEADMFKLPEGYQTTSPQKMMQQAMERMRQMTPEQRQQMQEAMRQRMEQGQRQGPPPGQPPHPMPPGQ